MVSVAGLPRTLRAANCQSARQSEAQFSACEQPPHPPRTQGRIEEDKITKFLKGGRGEGRREEVRFLRLVIGRSPSGSAPTRASYIWDAPFRRRQSDLPDSHAPEGACGQRARGAHNGGDPLSGSPICGCPVGRLPGGPSGQPLPGLSPCATPKPTAGHPKMDAPLPRKPATPQRGVSFDVAPEKPPHWGGSQTRSPTFRSSKRIHLGSRAFIFRMPPTLTHWH